MLRYLLALLLFAGTASAQTLPANVANRMGVAQTFLYSWTQSQYASYLPFTDFVWSDQPGNSQGGPTTFTGTKTYSSAYTACCRVDGHTNPSPYGTVTVPQGCAGPCNLAWFQTNHPTWVLYKTDQLTPAYAFADLNFIPFDFSNTAARTWFLANQVAPLLGIGYSAVSLDNVTLANTTAAVGTCSIKPTTNCTSDGGTWVALYSGLSNDATFRSNLISWIAAVTSYVHTNFPGKSVAANISYDTNYTTDMTTIIGDVDIWYDENGITGSAEPATCNPGNTYSGATWISKIQFITGLNSGAGPNAYVSENNICPYTAFSQPGVNSNFEVMQFAAASHLLHKNAHTYMQSYFSAAGGGCNSSYYCKDTYRQTNWPEQVLAHGAASGAYAVTGSIYNRTFANALALVNPNTTTAFTYALGASYHRSDCSNYSGTITLQPMTGMVLLNGAATKCIRGKGF